MKHTFITRLLCSIFPYKVIENCQHDPYLVRWYVFKSSRVSLFIHKFIRSDEDRALHDHPWSFLVIPIWRGYWEHSEHWPDDVGPMPKRRRVYPILGTRYRPATFRHRVELLKGAIKCPQCKNSSPSGIVTPEWVLSRLECPTCLGDMAIIQEKPSWSLFFHFKREREWGFHPPEGFVPWQKWWNDKCT